MKTKTVLAAVALPFAILFSVGLIYDAVEPQSVREIKKINAELSKIVDSVDTNTSYVTPEAECDFESFAEQERQINHAKTFFAERSHLESYNGYSMEYHLEMVNQIESRLNEEIAECK